jgi:hypothetical protein
MAENGSRRSRLVRNRGLFPRFQRCSSVTEQAPLLCFSPPVAPCGQPPAGCLAPLGSRALNSEKNPRGTASLFSPRGTSTTLLSEKARNPGYRGDVSMPKGRCWCEGWVGKGALAFLMNLSQSGRDELRRQVYKQVRGGNGRGGGVVAAMRMRDTGCQREIQTEGGQSLGGGGIARTQCFPIDARLFTEGGTVGGISTGCQSDD